MNRMAGSKRVVIAPDSFKGTASAAEIARSLADGWASARPSDEIVLRPMADGGEGTLDALLAAGTGGRLLPVIVAGPDDSTVHTSWLSLPAWGGALPEDGPAGEPTGFTAVVELASTSGITLLDELRPMTAHTYGFGQAIAAALDAGADQVVLAIGGSASTDGGAGLLTALGARLLDVHGDPIPRGNAGLGRLARVDLSGLRPVPRGGALVLSDVTNPLLGEHGAVAVFGAQKGIDDDLADTAEQNLAHFAALLATAMSASASAPASAPVSAAAAASGIESHRADPQAVGSGAAGGTGFALQAWGATSLSGAEAIASCIGLSAAMSGAQVVVTGEGRYDGQSEQGKVPGVVRSMGHGAGAHVLLVAGSVEAAADEFEAQVSLSELAGGSAAAMAETRRWAREAGRVLAGRIGDSDAAPRSAVSPRR